MVPFCSPSKIAFACAVLLSASLSSVVKRICEIWLAIAPEADAAPARRAPLTRRRAAQRGGRTGMNAARRFAQMRTDTANYSLDEAEMNRLGYYILNTLKAPRDAVQIFEMNVAGFPRSANTYDSLGEAYSRRPTPRRQSRLPEVGQPESAELECDRGAQATALDSLRSNFCTNLWASSSVCPSMSRHQLINH
jgi:hypothetical protein